MHIAFNGWFWDQPWAGSGQYLRGLLHALQKIAPDLQMTLILPPHNTTPDDLPENVNTLITRGRGGRLGKILFEQRTFPRMAAQVGADIAHVPYWGPPLVSPVRLVTSVLDVIPLMVPEYAMGIGNRLYTGLVSAAARGSAHVLTLSAVARFDIETQLNIPADNITVTHLAAGEQYHPQLGAERDEAVRQKYHLPDERFILYLGSFDLRKNVNLLLAAFTFVTQAEPDVLLVLAGKPPRRYDGLLFPDLPAYAQELGIADKIIWTGFIDEEDKPALYRTAEVSVFPSFYEGFGLPLLEAMACGTPVVALDIEVMREVAGDGAFLVKDDPRKMAGAMLALLGQPPLHEAMVTQGLARVSNFSWRKTAKATLAVYEQVLRN